MSGTAVLEFSSSRVKPSQKQAGQRYRSHPANVAVHARNYGFRIGSHSRVRPNQSHQVRGPHPGRQTFAADVTQRQNYAGARRLHREKVAGKMANREDFAGDLEVTVTNQTRSTQPPVNLRGFENCRMQISVILL